VQLLVLCLSHEFLVEAENDIDRRQQDLPGVDQIMGLAYLDTVPDSVPVRFVAHQSQCVVLILGMWLGTRLDGLVKTRLRSGCSVDVGSSFSFSNCRRNY
jgi:hypothetical protein